MADIPPSPESSFRERPLLALFPPAAAAEPRTSTRVQPQPSPARDHERAYGLSEAPFTQHIDLRFLYVSAEHERVMQELLAAVRRRDGLVTLTGSAGTGKTLLSRAVVDRLDRRTLTSVVTDPVQTIEGLLSIVLANFGVISSGALWRAMEPGRREKLDAALHDFLHSLAPLEAVALLWIDDVERFPDEILQELVALVGGHVKARRLQLVLSGGDSLEQVLGRLDLDAAVGGISTRLTLGPLTEQEIEPYVLRRLDVAGSSHHVSFDDAVSPRVIRLTGGIPAAINALCDRALEFAYVEGVAEIDRDVIDQAADSLDGRAGGRRRWTDAIVLFLVIVVSSATGGSLAALLLRQRVA